MRLLSLIALMAGAGTAAYAARIAHHDRPQEDQDPFRQSTTSLLMETARDSIPLDEHLGDQFFRAQLAHIVAQRGPNPGLIFLKEAITIVLGCPEAEWQECLQQQTPNPRGGEETNNASDPFIKLQTVLNAAASASLASRLQVYHLMVAHGMAQHERLRGLLPRSFDRALFLDPPAQVIAALEQVGFLSDLPAFDPCLLPEKNSTSVFAMIVRAIRSVQNAELTKLNDEFRKHQPTFGTALFIACLSNPRPELAATLQPYDKALARLKSAEMSSLVPVFREIWTDYDRQIGATKLPGLKKARTLAAITAIERLPITKHPSELAATPERFDELISNALPDIAAHDADKAESLLCRAVQLVEWARLSGTWRIEPSWTDLNYASTLLIRASEAEEVPENSKSDPSEPPLVMFGLAMKLYLQQDRPEFYYSWQHTPLHWRFPLSLLVGKTKRARPLLDCIQRKLGDLSPVLLIGVFEDLVRDMRGTDVRSLSTDAQLIATSTPALKPLAEQLLAACALSGMIEPVSTNDAALLLRRELQDTTLKPGVRLELAAYWLSHEQIPLNSADTRLCAATLLPLFLPGLEHNRSAMTKVLGCFNHLPRDAAWRSQATQLRVAWLQRPLQDTHIDRFDATRCYATAELLSVALELFAMSATPEEMCAFHKVHGADCAMLQCTVVLLARHERVEQLQAILAQPYTPHDLFRSASSITAQPDDATACELIDQTQGDEAAKLRALIFAATLPDQHHAYSVKLAQRAATRLCQMKNFDDITLNCLLKELVVVADAAAPLAASFYDPKKAARAVKSLSNASPGSADMNSWIQCWLALGASYAGDDKPLLTLLGELHGSDIPATKSIRVKELLSDFLNRLFKRWLPTHSIKHNAWFLHTGRILIDNWPEHIQLASKTSELLSNLLVQAAATNQMASIAKWRESMSPQRRASIEGRIWRYSWLTFATSPYHEETNQPDTLASILLILLSDPWGRAITGNSGTINTGIYPRTSIGNQVMREYTHKILLVDPRNFGLLQLLRDAWAGEKDQVPFKNALHSAIKSMNPETDQRAIRALETALAELK